MAWVGINRVYEQCATTAALFSAKCRAARAMSTHTHFQALSIGKVANNHATWTYLSVGTCLPFLAVSNGSLRCECERAACVTRGRRHMAQTNESTIVGVFEDYSTAQTVARELMDSGIPREAVQVNSNFATGAAGSGQQYDTEEHGTERQEHGGGISGFFHRLFGSDRSDDEY